MPTVKVQQQIFGNPVSGQTFGPLAVAASCDYSDGNIFLRVGRTYDYIGADATSTIVSGSGSSTPEDYKIYTSKAKEFQIGDYIRVMQPGKQSTTNAKVKDYIPSGDQANATGLELVDTGTEAVALADTYTDTAPNGHAFIERSDLPNACSEAEAFLYALDYGTANYLESAGFVTGKKSTYEFTTSGIVGPQAVTSMTVAAGTATIVLPVAITNRFSAGELIHIAGAAAAAANGEFEVQTVVGADMTVTVPQRYGTDLLTGQVPVGDYVTVAVTPGAQYRWTKGSNETTLINGSAALIATGNFTAEGNVVRVYCAGTADGNLTIIDGLADGVVAVASGAAAITVAILAPNDVIKVSQSGKNTTFEAKVKEIVGGNRVKLYPAPVTEVGYLPVVLQDAYDSGLIQKAQRNADGTMKTVKCIHLLAATPGTWANSDGATTGLWVTVAPGSAPGSKKLLVFERGNLVETIDNLSTDSASVNYYPTRINAESQFIGVMLSPADSTTVVGMLTTASPAITFKGWNQASQVVNFATFGTGGNGVGFNGETANFDDYVGTYDVATDHYTGLRSFLEEGSQFDLSVICCPGLTNYAVHQELLNIAAQIHCEAILDHEKGINARRIVDWTNGVGDFAVNRTKIDNWHGGVWWNWFQMEDPFTGTTIWAPPSVGVIRQMAYTADHFKPWQAAAGELRGIITTAKQVEFPHVSQAAKEAMYGGGQSVNPILRQYGSIMIYGNRTLLRDEAEQLADMSTAMLLNYILRGMSGLGRKYVFDPNDPELLSMVRGDCTGFLAAIKGERGIEDFGVQVDSDNNTLEVRQQRAAIVDFWFTPYGIIERLYINATLRKSGATVNNIR